MAEIEILGGEPFVYENRLKAALKYIQNTGMQLKAISTNGIIYNEKCVRLLSSTKELDFFQVSVDAATSETYKIIRPPGNNFDKVIANIRKFVAKGLPVSMSFVITKINAREISSFYQLAEKLGVHRISFGTFRPLGEGLKVKEWGLNSAEFKAAKDAIKVCVAKYTNIKTVFNESDELTKPDICDAGLSKVAVLPNGDIYPCSMFFGIKSSKLGNVRTYIDGKKVFEIIQEETLNTKKYWKKCIACKISNRDTHAFENY